MLIVELSVGQINLVMLVQLVMVFMPTFYSEKYVIGNEKCDK